MNEIWQPSSLFLRSELINWRAHSVLEDLGGAVVVRTPSNPSRTWGHVLLLKAPPRTEDIPRWRSVFETKIKPHQPVPTWILSWDGPMIDSETLDAYCAEGLRYHSFDVLILGSLGRPALFKTGIEIVDLKFESDLWPEVIESNMACFKAANESGDDRRINFAGHRSMIASGRGHWYAAFFEGQLAGSLGLFSGNGLCRFQEIYVAAPFRRLGVATKLICHAAAEGLAEHPGKPQIIVASRTGDGIHIYHSLGFVKYSESHTMS